MTGRKRATEASSSKSKLPEVPMLVFDKRNNKQYKKGDFLGKVSYFMRYRYCTDVTKFCRRS